MDIRIPKIDGIEIISKIRREAPQARVFILTTVTGDVQALRAFRAGAAGYLLKDVLRMDLTETIRVVHAGGRPILPEIAQQIAERAADDPITPRELDVLW
jgi:DNA-binding NarL/FixJ family response regulator